MTDAVEPVGQDVDQEAADELVGVECHELVAGVALGPVILPFESHALADRLIFRRQRAAKNRLVMRDAVAQVAQRRDRLEHEIVLGTDHLSLSTPSNLTMGAPWHPSALARIPYPRALNSFPRVLCSLSPGSAWRLGLRSCRSPRHELG